MAIDINLNSVHNALQEEKYYACGQYFTLVDENSKQTSYRAGIQLFAFKGD